MSTSVPGNSCRTCRPCNSSTNQGCIIRLPGECVYYSGTHISGPDINTGDNFNIVVNKLSSTAGTVTSVGLIMPAAFSVANSPVTSEDTIAVTAIGTTEQYIRGDGTLATLPVTYANNGLTLTGTVVQMGGTLTQFTDIDTTGNMFFMHGTGEIALRSASGTVQSDADVSSIGASITSRDTSINLFSEVNSTPAMASVVGGNTTTFYNRFSVTATSIKAEVKSNTITPLYLQLDTNGKLRANAYGTGAITGTATYTLQVDSLGNIIEGSLSPASANNGLTVSGSTVQIGQSIGQIGDPAALLSDREIPMGAFSLSMRDSSGNSNLFGPGTITSTRIIGGSNISLSANLTTNTNSFCVNADNRVTFGSFSNATAFSTPLLGRKRFNTIASGVTITTSPTNRQGALLALLEFENDVAANSNSITISGAPIAAICAKVDLWPVAGGQLKTINGTGICAYSTFLDAQFVATGSSVSTYIEYEAGRYLGNAGSPLTITNRYGFKVIDLNAGSQITTNRWAFYQDGTTDGNFFAGLSGFGIPLGTPAARIHIGAGSATAGTAPLKLTSGTNLTTPENGAFEFDGTNLYFTVGGVRKTVQLV